MNQVRLRDVERGDLPLFYEHQRDPVAVAMVQFQSRDAAAFEQHWARILADEKLLKKTILSGDQVAGNIGSFDRDGKREVGYWLDRALWGRGIATAALREFLRLEPIRPLFAGVAPHNLASLRVLQKCGFTVSPPADEAAADSSHLILTLEQ